MSTKVINIRTKQPYDVYIGRISSAADDGPLSGAGKFGNPFPLAQCGGDRVACLAKYRNYFYKRMDTDKQFRKDIEALKGKTLGCFCAPQLCHGHVIAEWLDRE